MYEPIFPGGGGLVSFWVAVVVAALGGAVVQGAAPIRVEARQTSPVGFVTTGPIPFTDAYTRVEGTVSLEVEDRVATATRGDRGRLTAAFAVDGARYELTLDEVGLPPSWIRAIGHPIEGGVVIDRTVNGGAPIGFAATTPARAAAVLWGVGEVRKNGELVSDRALVIAQVLRAGTHADDDTHRLLPEARALDGEIEVLALGLPVEVDPRGFLQIGFDEVRITVEGDPLPLEEAIATVPSRSPEEATAAAHQRGIGGAGVVTAPIGVYGGGVPGPLPVPINAPAATATQLGRVAAVPQTTAPAERRGMPRPPPGVPFDAPAQPLPEGISPLNAQPAEPLVPGIPPANAEPAPPRVLGISPLNADPAEPLVPGISPANAEPAPPLPLGISPFNAAPAEPLVPGIPPANAQPAPPLISGVPPVNTAPVAPPSSAGNASTVPGAGAATGSGQ